MNRIIIALIAAVAAWMAPAPLGGCTSAIISGRLTRSGKPLLWKHRDTSAADNFVERVPASHAGELDFVALFNAGDSLLAQAWMGMNDAGLAIMNTASYNLAPDTARVKDREGFVMARALATCRSLADFETLLDTLPRPMGIQANFGIIDRDGNAAYYEADDFSWKRFGLEDAPEGYIIRTNYSLSGDTDGGYGYIRCANAAHLIAPAAARRDISPELLTDTVSRSFYHSLFGRDMAAAAADRYIVDQDFIPRESSVASIVIEGTTPGDMVMWTLAGYPPAGHVVPVTVDSVPRCLRPVAPGWHSPEWDASRARKALIFPIRRGSGPRYIDVDALRRISGEQRRLSLEAYERFRNR